MFLACPKLSLHPNLINRTSRILAAPGRWTLKHRLQIEPIVKKVGAGLEQDFASRTRLKATIHQTEQVIMVATRGPGFALDETLCPDGSSHPSDLKLLGANCLTATTSWSKPQAARRDISDQNQTGKRGPTDRRKVPGGPGENRGLCRKDLATPVRFPRPGPPPS